MLKNGEYSIKDISKMTGVSIATLSRYFNGQGIKKSNEEKILRVLKETGYKPNIAARFMKGQRTGMIGLILPELTHPFFAAIADSVMDEARKNGWAVLCGSSQGSKEIEKEIIDQFSHSILDGLIYIPVSQAENIPSIDSFRNLPLVVTARRDILPGVPHIYHDGQKGGYLATKFLLQLGRDKIAFVASFWNPPCKDGMELISFLDNPLSSTFSSCERLRGYIKALNEYGIKVDPDLIILSSYSFEDGKDAASVIMGNFKSCNGVILMDQSIASGCQIQFESQGLRVPEDISLIIYDSGDVDADYRFTKIELQLKEMGIQSLRTLKKLIDGVPADDVCLDVKLTPNESTTILKRADSQKT